MKNKRIFLIITIFTFALFFVALNCVELSDIDLPQTNTFYYDDSILNPPTTQDQTTTTTTTTTTSFQFPTSGTNPTTVSTTTTLLPPDAPSSITAYQIVPPPTSITASPALKNQIAIQWSALPTPHTQVKVEWSYVLNKDYYNIYRSTVIGNIGTLVGTTTSTEYIDIPPGTSTYYYQITAENSAGEGNPSTQQSIDYSLGTASGVVLMRSRSGGSYSRINYNDITNVNGGSFTDKLLPSDSTYYYKVAGVIGGTVSSELSDDASATTIPPNHSQMYISFAHKSYSPARLGLYLNVYDQDGDVFHNLTMTNITSSLENGAAKSLFDFKSITSQENVLSGAITMDYSGSMGPTNCDSDDIRSMEYALNSGLIQTSKIEDRFAIIKYDDNISTIQSFTKNTNLLETAVFFCPSLGGLTHAWDAICTGLSLAITEPSDRRRFVVAFTDGESYGDTSSCDTYQNTASEAIDNRMAIYNINFGDTSAVSEQQYMSDHSGGALIVLVDPAHEKTGMYEMISKQLNNTYVLGMIVAGAAGTDNTISLTVNSGGQSDTQASRVRY